MCGAVGVCRISRHGAGWRAGVSRERGREKEGKVKGEEKESRVKWM